MREGQQADAGRERAPLMVNVDTEAPHVLPDETQVHRLLLLQLVQLRGLEER